MAGQLGILPAELRMQIYRNVFFDADNETIKMFPRVPVSGPCSPTTMKFFSPHPCSVQLLRTSHLIHTEALPILYGEITLHLSADTDLPSFLWQIGSRARSCVRHIVIERVQRDPLLATLLLDGYGMPNLRSITLDIQQEIKIYHERRNWPRWWMVGRRACEEFVDELRESPILLAGGFGLLGACVWKVTFMALDVSLASLP